MYVADGVLNVPVERAWHGVRRLAAVEAAAGAFEHATSQVREHTGLALGKRQVEELTVRAAVDFEHFYAERVNAADLEPAPRTPPTCSLRATRRCCRRRRPSTSG